MPPPHPRSDFEMEVLLCIPVQAGTWDLFASAFGKPGFTGVDHQALYVCIFTLSECLVYGDWPRASLIPQALLRSHFPMLCPSLIILLNMKGSLGNLKGWYHSSFKCEKPGLEKLRHLPGDAHGYRCQLKI